MATYEKTDTLSFEVFAKITIEGVFAHLGESEAKKVLNGVYKALDQDARQGRIPSQWAKDFRKNWKIFFEAEREEKMKKDEYTSKELLATKVVLKWAHSVPLWVTASGGTGKILEKCLAQFLNIPIERATNLFHHIDPPSEKLDSAGSPINNWYNRLYFDGNVSRDPHRDDCVSAWKVLPTLEAFFSQNVSEDELAEWISDWIDKNLDSWIREWAEKWHSQEQEEDDNCVCGGSGCCECGQHQYAVFECKECGTAFCFSCCGFTNVHLPVDVKERSMTCPHCGADAYS